MKRSEALKSIGHYLSSYPVVALLGPRQCGKTTLARMLSGEDPSFKRENYFDLENPADIQRLTNPVLTLKPLKGLIIIDEIQKLPDFFPVLRFLVDEPGQGKRYLILGSASRELIRQSSETLAGRIAYYELTPFSYEETHDLETLWLRGGFPRSFLADSDQVSGEWREFYIRTFLEQDIPNLGISIPPNSLRKFWMMLAHYHGNLFNASEIGRSFGASDTLMKKYLDILTGTFMIRQLQPWHANISKRQVKAFKIYFRDSGIFHSLLNLPTLNLLNLHPKVGASWEGFAIEEIIRSQKSPMHQCFFWSTYSGAELDLLIQTQNGLIGYECKYSDAPSLTKSMKIALEDLNLKHLYVIYPGDVDYPLTEKITVKSLKNYLAETKALSL